MSGSLCVLVSSSMPVGFRGALNQWMIEVLPGIFVGRPSARIRDWLWLRLVESLPETEAYAAMIQQSDCEQGFNIRRVGDHRYEVTDFLGIQLVTVEHRHQDTNDYPPF